MTVICTSFVFALLFINGLHLLFESHLFDQLLHLSLGVGLTWSKIQTHGLIWLDIVGVVLVREVTAERKGVGCIGS